MDFVDIHIMKTYLDTKATSINVVSEEEVICLGEASANLERLHQIVLQIGAKVSCSKQIPHGRLLRLHTGRGCLHTLG